MQTDQLPEYRPDDRTRAELLKFGQLGVLAGLGGIFACLLQGYVLIRQIIYLRKVSPATDILNQWLFAGLCLIMVIGGLICYAASRRLLKALHAHDGADLHSAVRRFRIWLQLGLVALLLNMFVFARTIWLAPEIYRWK